MTASLASEEVFQAEVIGFFNQSSITPLPAPPTYTGELIPADVRVYKILGLRLSYLGTETVSISNLTISQEINTYNTSWFIDTPLVDQLPQLFVLQTQNNSIYLALETTKFFYEWGILHIQIKTTNQEIWDVSSLISRNLDSIITWPPHTTNTITTQLSSTSISETQSTSTPGMTGIMLIVSFISIITTFKVKWKRPKSEN